MEDSQIVGLFQARSERAIAEADLKYGKYLHAISYNILSSHDDADEAVNDTYMGAWNSIPPHRPAVLRTFLGKIARRVSLKKYRDAHRGKRGGDEVSLVLDELDECVPAPSSVEDVVLARELSALLNDFLRDLPEVERSVFVCRYWYLDSIGAISRQFGFTGGKTKSMLYRTRTKLRAYLRKEEI